MLNLLTTNNFIFEKKRRKNISKSFHYKRSVENVHNKRLVTILQRWYDLESFSGNVKNLILETTKQALEFL